MQERGNFGLSHPEHFCCLHLSQAAFLDQHEDPVYEIGLCLKKVGIGKAQISEYITAAFGYVNESEFRIVANIDLVRARYKFAEEAQKAFKPAER